MPCLIHLSIWPKMTVPSQVEKQHKYTYTHTKTRPGERRRFVQFQYGVALLEMSKMFTVLQFCWLYFGMIWIVAQYTTIQKIFFLQNRQEPSDIKRKRRTKWEEKKNYNKINHSHRVIVCVYCSTFVIHFFLYRNIFS